MRSSRRSPKRRESSSPQPAQARESSPEKKKTGNLSEGRKMQHLKEVDRVGPHTLESMNSMNFAGILVCAFAGMAAALASVFGKLALSDFISLPAKECQRLGVADLCHNFGAPLIYILRAASLGMLIVSNIVMTTSFTRAMHMTSSLTATVATTSFNFSSTAILSMLVFGETLPLMWWGGFACILMGVALLTTGQNGAVCDGKRAQKVGLRASAQGTDVRTPRGLNLHNGQGEEGGGLEAAGGSSTLEAQVRLRLAEDEALARALQEEEDMSTRRRTRGGSAKSPRR